MSNVYALRDPDAGRGGGRGSAVGAAGTRAAAGGRLSRWARPLLVVLSVACAAGLGARFIAEPLMQIHHVVVHSDLALADDQVLALSGLAGGEHWYSVSPATIEKRLETNPLVRRARVEKVFPDTLRMTVWGRIPAALVLAVSSGRTVPVLVDGDGVVFKIGSSSAEVDLPVISGIAAGDTVLGTALPHAYAPLFSDLAALKQSAPTLYALISEVKVVAPASDVGAGAGMDYLLYLTCAPIPIRARGTVDESLLRSALMVIDLLSRQGVVTTIQELDFRSGDVVYRTKRG